MTSQRLRAQALIVILLGALGLITPFEPASGEAASSAFICDCPHCLEGFECPDEATRDQLCETSCGVDWACGYCIFDQAHNGCDPWQAWIPCMEA
jgi:hypothetical protein